MNFPINKDVILARAKSFGRYARKTVVFEFFVNPAMLTMYVAIVAIVAISYWSDLQASVVQTTNERKTEITPSRPDFTDAQLAITQEFAQESIKAFIQNPHSRNLHRVGCALFDAQMQGYKPLTMLKRFGDCPDEFKQKMGLLLEYTCWFTDYVYESPSFKYGQYIFQYDLELGSDVKADWIVFDSNGDQVRMTWGQIVCLVMGIDYDPQYDQALVVYGSGIPTNPEDRPHFIGPKQS